MTQVPCCRVEVPSDDLVATRELQFMCPVMVNIHSSLICNNIIIKTSMVKLHDLPTVRLRDDPRLKVSEPDGTAVHTL